MVFITHKKQNVWKKTQEGQKVEKRSITDMLFGGYLWKLKDKPLCKTAYSSNSDS